LERARAEIRELARRAEGDRLGLVAFAGEARLSVPLTRDRESFATLASRAGILTVPGGGTDLGAALGTALVALAGRSEGPEAVFLITDGEDLAGRGREAAAACRARGIPVYCLGLGTELGAKIPDDSGEGFVRDGSGRDVVSRLDPAFLEKIADATGGEYSEAGTSAGALVKMYEENVLPAALRSLRAEERRRRENRYQWPLLAAILLWTLDLGFSERRR
ncbi:MAG: VWA domain-containing protein, partial [Candidatus Latescibacteria bacterium]|nr:VWA domain-containing protein [Candidatus Latescibacterota bacterium]